MSDGWTTRHGWQYRAARLRHRRNPDVQAKVLKGRARLIEIDHSVFDLEPDREHPVVIDRILEQAEHRRAERRDQAVHCRPPTGPSLRVLPGGGESEPRVDAG